MAIAQAANDATESQNSHTEKVEYKKIHLPLSWVVKSKRRKARCRKRSEYGMPNYGKTTTVRFSISGRQGAVWRCLRSSCGMRAEIKRPCCHFLCSGCGISVYGWSPDLGHGRRKTADGGSPHGHGRSPARAGGDRLVGRRAGGCRTRSC